MEQGQKKRSGKWGMFLPIGLGLGIGLGALLGNIGVGMSFGAAIGTTLSLLVYYRERGR